MKRICLSVIVMLLSIPSFAQFGIVGGLTTTNSNIITAATELSTKKVSQYHVGLTYKIGFFNFLAVQPGIVYNVKGASMSELSLSDIDYQTGYVEVPVQLQIGAGIGPLVRVYGIAEPFAGYAISNKVKFEGVSEETWDNVKDRLEYGFGLGAGVEVLKRVQLNLRYFWNLGTTYEDSINFQGISKQIGESKFGGISLSAVILL